MGSIDACRRGRNNALHNSARSQSKDGHLLTYLDRQRRRRQRHDWQGICAPLALAIVRSSTTRQRRENSTIAERKLKSMPVHDVERRVRVRDIFIDRTPFNRGVLEFGHESVIDFTRSIETAQRPKKQKLKQKQQAQKTTTTTVDNRTYKLYRGE